ncbi:peptide ABC transporter ATP-binding protein [candidate division KSB3 bacterium]|uniref:Peptide ABC transporter ATP-binding protein n=1 Tax=candidate division KSB3 bacterium TaxID=2044937 RepID=A0A2G6KHK3_9BACT|nr:MAG: peptide ABC transporter ATP-binding protein [candidate division KSB3 bacterium]
MTPLLEVKDLAVEFRIPEGILRAPDGVSFQIAPQEILGVVGESGSGKSVTALSVMGLIPNPPGKMVAGEVLFQGHDLKQQITDIRGQKISMVFQNPLNSLNPSLRIGLQLTEVLVEHLKMAQSEAEERAITLMRQLGIPEPQTLLTRYPFEFSGGMRQRIMIAMAMLCNPTLMIADEPTTALDVTIQAQMLHLFQQLREQFQTSIMYITHDLSVVSQIADRVLVMYAGKIVERAETERIFSAPRHPYTQGLIRSIPGMNTDGATRLHSITGNVPNLIHPPPGCRFHPRCSQAMDICRHSPPSECQVEGSSVFCWLYRGEEEQ